MVQFTAGAQRTITGSVSIFDETSALEAVTGTVDDTGRVTFPPDSLVNAVPIPMGVDTCGTITQAPTMLTFGLVPWHNFSKPLPATAAGVLRSWAR